MAEAGSIDAWVEDEINAFFSTEDRVQAKRYRAYCRIVIDGRDVTDRLDPYLISVTVRNTGMCEATIELDDRDARLAIPPLQASVEIDLGWTSESVYRAFTGWVIDVEHGFGRRMGGRRMFIQAKGTDLTSSVKTPFQDHIGEGAPPGQMEAQQPIPFLQAFQQFSKNANLNVELGASLAGIKSDYWAMSNESIMQWVARQAEEHGAWHQFTPDHIKLGRPGDFDPAPLIGRWGENLIGWRIKPYAARPLWSGSSQQFFDHVKGLWQNLDKQFNLPMPWGGASAIIKLPMPAPNSNVAEQQNDGAGERASTVAGQGRVIINGEPKAQMWSSLQIIGARPGVDGMYKVECAVHTYSRQGYVTTLEVYPDVIARANNIGATGYDLSGQEAGAIGEAAGP